MKRLWLILPLALFGLFIGLAAYQMTQPKDEFVESRMVGDALAKRGVPIVGVAIRDEPEAIAQFLDRYGNPYSAIARDDIAELQLALGSSGVPETFVIDGKGVIRYQHIGDIRADNIDEIYAEWEKAR
mgnify:CR=1 FL=1